MFNVGDRVKRIENREVTGATVLEVAGSGDDQMLLLQYDEGGTGWWPASALEAE